MKNLINKLKNNTGNIIVWSGYLLLFIASATAYSIIRDKRLAAEDHCERYHGVLFTDRAGAYICIKEKSIVK
jgi:hypothetical protein